MQILNTHPVKKSDLGFHGNLFGGKLLAWLDASAAAYAAQCCDTPRMVTVSIDKCVFKRPAKEGQLIKIYGRCLKIGKTSVTIEIEARRHSIYNGTQKPVCKCQVVFVRIDGDGEPVPIAPHIRKKIEDK